MKPLNTQSLLSLSKDMFIEPRKIRSPYTGETVIPKITSFTQDGKIFDQVVYNDPITGNFIKKGLVCVKDGKTGKVLQDFNSNNMNSISTHDYRV